MSILVSSKLNFLNSYYIFGKLSLKPVMFDRLQNHPVKYHTMYKLAG